ncbi:winged helix-turn-helix transcriptional regulator [Pseudomonas sp. ABC1]|uniref:MarR family winged helix-turn-helix transcriptional regulator n=1 Tax=Pseudomonas sp. ABC1 TaxID=2748080 RepID=UPI0015C3C21F|nr:MarR family winged helix-turn-helix transcriptional regulator [Pseudomonas sp. ABC1]QLF92654.1 winged helix-turn-helix transcriptional regulator [Pseudomonas sp. ABC1]
MLPTECLCTRLRRASRGVSKLYDDALHGVGINVAQYSLLRHLDRLVQPSITDLADAMGLERSTLGRNLRVLEGKGLVVLLDGIDRRNRPVALTQAGEQALAKALQAWSQVQDDLNRRLPQQQMEALNALLASLSDDSPTPAP